MRRWCLRGSLLAALVVAAVAGRVSAQGAAQVAAAGDAPAAAVVAKLPRSAELIVVLDGAARLRQTALWEVLRPAMGDLEGMEATWGQLATTLGWTPEETFDRVLGTRVALVVRGLDRDVELLGGAGAAGGAAGGMGEGNERVRWALISEVSAETERRLLERLAAAPRDIVRGCTLLALERGKYELAIHRPKGGGWGGKRGALPSTLIFGPAGKAELLDELIGVMTDGAAAPMAGTAAHAALAGLGSADAVVLYRWPSARGEAWADFAAVSVQRGIGGEWSARLSVRDAALRAGLAGVPVSGDAAFRGLASDPMSLAAMVETRVAGDAGEGEAGGDANPAGMVLTLLGMPESVQAGLAPRQALLVQRGVGADGGVKGLGIALALEVKDVAGIAPAGDAMMAELVAGIEGADGDGGGQAGVPDFGGVSPGAVRATSLRRTPRALAAMVGGEIVEEGGGAALAWTFAGDGVGAGGGGPGGWWLMATAPSEGGSVDRAVGMTRRLAAGMAGSAVEGEGGAARWLMQGMVRPAALEGKLDEGAPVPGSWRGILRRLDRVSWGLFVGDSGGVEGTIRAKVLEPKGAAPGR